MSQKREGLRGQLRLFLEPESVALVGVPRRTGRGSFNVLENLLGRGFAGAIYPVNPKAEEILGVKAYPSIKALPKGIDLSVIMIPREAVHQAIADCAGRGIKAVIVVTQGFAEAGEQGKALQEEVSQVAKAAKARIIGPNSLGVFNNFANFCTTLLPPPRERNPVALVTQSGGLFEGFADFTAGKAIDLGNMCDVDFAEVLEYLAEDPETKVIALHIEGIGEGRRFLKVASRVSKGKPVLALKAGRSERAAGAIASHSGSLMGKDEVYGALFKQAGLIRAWDLEELSDLIKAFLNLPPIKGNRIGVVTPSGAEAVMVLDALEEHGLEAAQLSQLALDRLRDFFPPWAPPANPVDMMTAGLLHGYKRVYTECLEALLQEEKVDGILCIAGSPTLKTIKEVSQGKDKPVVTSLLGTWRGEVFSRMEEVGYWAVYPTPERAVRALAALRDYAALSHRQDRQGEANV